MLTSSEKQNEFLVRNREIQRRSRARRKDYIEDLENRVRQYQRDGTQATVEVQAAARKVAEENYWLHSLLAKHGITTAEITDHLDSSRAASRSLNPEAVEVSGRNSQPHDRIDYQSRPLPAQVAQSAQSAQSSPRPITPTTAHGESDLGLLSPISILGSPDHESVLYATEDHSLVDDVQSSIMATETLDSNSSFEGLHAKSMPCHACEHTPAIRGVDETSCEDAARIIAGMRGDEHPERVWPELGCSATRRTMVKNITIFQMVDERQ